MDGAAAAATGPDFSQGVPKAQAPQQGVLAGHVGGEPVLLARRADGFWAVCVTCTHCGGALGEGLTVGDTLGRDLESLRGGEALRG